MYQTRNDVHEQVRIKMIPILQDRLADALDLTSQAKQAHWNIKGPDFIALHELFDTIATSSLDYSDQIAERIVQFGGIAEGTIRIVANRTQLPGYPLTAKTGPEHVAALSTTLSHFADLLQKTISIADGLQDPVTSDIFVQVNRDVDKYLWFVEAHNQSAH